MSKIILTTFSLIAFTCGYSQERSIKNAVFAEFIGSGGLYSINYEYQFQKNAARIGFAIYPETVSVPITIGRLIGKSNDLLELGIGVTILKFVSDSETELGILFLTGVIGYRYQRPDNRFLFRIGFTPLININDVKAIDFKRIIPLGGMSFGFRF